MVAYIVAFDTAVAQHWGEERRRPLPNGKDIHTDGPAGGGIDADLVASVFSPMSR